MKKSAKKLLVAITLTCTLSSFMLTGCGSKKGEAENSADATNTTEQTADSEETSTSAYTTGVDQTVVEGDWFPQWQFFKTISPITWMQTGESWSMTLEVDADNNYTLTSEIKPYDEGVIEGDASYHHAKTIATGTCTVDGDTIKIDKPTHASYEMQYGEFMEAYAEPWSFNSKAGEYGGAWDSNDIPEVLDIVPVTTFTVDGDKIVDFVCEGLESEAQEDAGQDAEQEAQDAADLGESLFQQVSDGGSTYLDFYNDNVYVFSFPDQDINENGTWSYDEATAVLTLTTPNGKICTSTQEEENVALLDFKTDLSDQLGGKFHINVTDFDAAVAQ